MVQLNLRPFPHVKEGFDAYLDINFKTLQEIVRKIDAIAHGVSEVTGELDVTTGLIIVEDCVASLNGIPVANACFVRAIPQAGGKIKVQVYKNDFTLSATTININWVAFGED